MKRILSVALCLLMLASLAALSGCGEPATLKFGAGVYVDTPTATNATADQNGAGTVSVTIAAVTVDEDGAIVACDLDTASNTVKYTADGRAIGNPQAKTKYEQGDDYNMVAYGKAQQEWYKQADAFEKLVAGKNLEQVKALLADANKGNAEVIAAGCTIMIHEFVGAIEKAYQAAGTSNVTAEHTLKVTAYTRQNIADATADKDGSNKVATTVFAAALDAEGKVVTAASDCVEVNFTFDTTGKSTFDVSKVIQSKKEQGSNYGMTAAGKQEWYIQVAAFDGACIGKTGDEIAQLATDDGKGIDSLQAAGCTINVSDLVKAASKIGK